MLFTTFIYKDDITTIKTKEITADVLQQAENQETDPMIRYSMIRQVAEGFKEARSKASQMALQDALTNHPESLAGNTFEHEGLSFQVQRTPQYDFTNKREWTSIKKRLDLAQKQLDIIKAELKAEEERLIISGKVERLQDKMVFKFMPR